LKEHNDILFTQLPSVERFGSITNKTKGDKVIWGLVLLLALIGIMVVYSATGTLAYQKFKGDTESFLFKQVAFTIIGLGVVYFLHRVNYTIYSRIAQILFYVSIPLLLYTLVFGAKINDGSRWIKLPIINLTIQTSDFAKLALFMYVSRQLSKKQVDINSFKKGFLPIIIPVATTAILIAPANLSNALLTAATSLLLMFIGRVPIKFLLLVVVIAAIPVGGLVGYAVATYTPPETTVETVAPNNGGGIKSVGRIGTWVKRVQDFVYADAVDEPYQVQQAKMAIANGGILFGKGPGNSEQRNYLPQAYNDFIYAIIIEEYGIFGGVFIVFIYLLFLFRCIKIFRRCPYAFGAFLALGLSFTLVIQAVANMAVNVNIVPVTGVTLPLVSMGGSSFIFTCAAIGIILSVARNVEQMEGKEPIAPNEHPIIAAKPEVA
jgi:cell division protein FtsW